MKQFIPFEDDWAMAEALASHRLVPYQPGMRCVHPGDAAPLSPGDAMQTEDRNLFAPSSQPSLPAL